MMRSFTIFLLTVISFYGFAQTKNIPKPNWQNLDLQQDSVFGSGY